MISGVPLVGSSPMDSSPTCGLWQAHHLCGERLAHHGELEEVLRTALGVGADVEKGDRRRHAGHDGADRRTEDTLDAAHVEDAGGDHGARVACRDEGVGRTAAHQAEADDDARARLVPRRVSRLFVVADDIGSVHNGDVLAVLRQKRPDLRLVADQHDFELIAGDPQSPSDGFVGGVVTSRCVDGDAHRALVRLGAPGRGDFVG